MDEFDEEDEFTSKSQKFFKFFNIKIVVVSLVILFFVVLFILIKNNSSSNRYQKMEEKLVSRAKEYVQDNMSLSVLNEIYLDAVTLEIELDNDCNNISGVFYDDGQYKPYLMCKDYKSKVLDNDSESISLYGDEIIVMAKGISFYDPGYRSDDEVRVAGEVGTTEGVYNLYYYNENDQSMLTRKIVIINNEELKNNFPIITLNGDDVIYVSKNEVFHDDGVVAIDSIDGDISSNVIVHGEIDTSTVGKQKIYYSITNSQGYTSTIERVVNIIELDTTIYADYLIEPTTKVNDRVTITLSIYGDNFDYVILPNGEEIYNNTINYKVTENGKYVFIIHDKSGNVTNKEVEITNIDKEPPKATCDAVIYDGYTRIDVMSTSNKPISTYDYQINNVSIRKSAFSSFRDNNTNVSSASVIIEDNVGNTSTIKCDVMNYNNWKMDYSKLFVFLEDNNNQIISKYSLEDYLKGVVYQILIDMDLKKYSDEQLQELFKIFFVLEKAELLSLGKYTIYSKQLIYKIDESKFCDVYSGCMLVEKNGKSFYVAKDINYEFDKNYKQEYDKLDNHILDIMTKAYNTTKKEVVVVNSFDEVLTKFTGSYTKITSSIRDNIMNDVLQNKGYREILSSRFSNYKIYNIDNYSSKFADVLKKKSYYYWPIGSTYADYQGLLNGSPESVDIIYDYGASLSDNKVHNGMAIRGECGKTKVIASKDGKVTNIGYDEKNGNYVIVQHDNNVSFLYGSLTKGSIAVNVGSVVKKGQLLGYVGKINDTCMLYLESRQYNAIVNPNEFISINNTRPASGDRIIYVEGGSVQRSVCLTLLASGFSMDATAGIMANIKRESNFNLNSVGDEGTSVGLCQWHNTRFDRLSNYCGNKTYTTECQLSYMLYELMNNYNSVYNYIIANNSAYDIGYHFCFYYEIPGARVNSCPKRGESAQNEFIPYVLNNCN